jgi:YVTN family beta-propeller protein
LSVATGALAQGKPAYHLVKTVPLAAPDRWDYLLFDPASQRVYAAHGDRVTVIDGHDGAIVGQVEAFPGGTHGIAIVTSAGRGYTDDGEAGEAASFDLRTLKPLVRIKSGPGADAIAFDPSTGHVYVINGRPGTVTVIDPQADRAIAQINVGGELEYAAADGHGKLFVNGEEKREIIRIDTRTNRVDARWPIPQCASPHGLAVDAAHDRLFSSCVNAILLVLDSNDGTTLATLPIGLGSDAVAFDPKRQLIFSSNGRDANLSVIREKDPRTFVSLESVPTAATARTMTLDPESGRLYLLAADIDEAAEKAASAAGQPARRPPLQPGSLKLLMLDPAD